MAHITREQLSAYFERYGWQHDVLRDGSIESGWQGERQFYPLSVSLTSMSVCFQVRPFISVGEGRVSLSQESWDVWPALMREVSALNKHLKLVKIVMVEPGELTLSCQVLAAGFSFTSFARILEVLGYYADMLYDEISPRLAVRPPYGQLFEVPRLLS